jgi:hypothetical protein
MRSDRFFAVTSRNAPSRLAASVGYHRWRYGHLARLLEQFQNSAWPCFNFSIPCWTYFDYAEDNAYFASDYPTIDTILLRRIVQRI